jgi:hypothetical protein
VVAVGDASTERIDFFSQAREVVLLESPLIAIG